MPSVRAGHSAPDTARLADYAGRWLVLIFYPRDFSLVCPTELTAFSARLADFQRRNCELLGVSADPVRLHQEWFATPVGEGGVGPLRFPLASDVDGDTARAYGVWIEELQQPTRGLFVIDPLGVLQYAVMHNLNVGRNPDEVLRVLEGLQSGGLCPANWSTADGTIDPERAIRPGTILGHYRVRSRLGGGAFGTVFSAWDQRLDRPVALKVLRQHLHASRAAVLAEARAAARLHHPRICLICAVEEEGGVPLIAMEFVEGRPLSELIERRPARQLALHIGRQLASGLSAAHSSGVVHGDLKPANVLVTAENHVKIVDFGLAQSEAHADWTSKFDQPLSQPASGSAEADGLAILATSDAMGVAPDDRIVLRGTPAYMSPEQAQGCLATPASDVFAFGLVFFEMLTGCRALGDESSLACLLRLRTQDIAAAIASDLDAQFQPVIAAILAREPGCRPAMSEVIRQLTALDGSPA